MFGSPLKSYSIRPHNDEMGGCDPEQAWDEVSAGHAVAAFEMPANSDADVRTALINSLGISRYGTSSDSIGFSTGLWSDRK
jgi:hypothetical protein